MRSELPISDYINDTKSVIEQIPRLLAAMESLSLEEKSFEGSFDLYCCFSLVRQTINSRCMVGEDPMGHLAGMSSNVKKRLSSQGIHDLRQFIQKVNAGQVKGLPSQIVTVVKKIPLFTVENISLKFETNKRANKNIGQLKFDLKLEVIGETKKRRANDDITQSFTIVVGTKDNNILLDQKSVIISLPHRQNTVQRQLTMSFDWSLANSNGGKDSGLILLRILSTDRRGLDIERQIKLT